MKNKPIVVNLIGGPGSGKSTSAAGIFYYLKMAGLNVELATEYAKDKVYEKSFHTLDDQFYVFGKQFHKIWRLSDDNDVIITDSPFILSIYYNKLDSKLFEDFVIEQYEKFNNVTCLIERNTEYNPTGRMQTEEEAASIDTAIKSILDKHNIPYIISKTNTVVEDILAELSSRLPISFNQKI